MSHPSPIEPNGGPFSLLHPAAFTVRPPKVSVTRRQPMQTLVRWITGSTLLALLAFGNAMAGTEGQDLLFLHAENVAALTAADRQDIYGQLGLKPGSDPQTLEFAEDTGCPPMPGAQVQGKDLNNDQYPEVFVSLGSTCMYGYAGSGVFLFIRDGSGHWKMHNLGSGIVVVQDTSHKGYADVMIGGPGFCQPVLSWTGTEYAFDHDIPEQPGACDSR